MGYHNHNPGYYEVIGCLANFGMTLGMYTREQSIIFLDSVSMCDLAQCGNSQWGDFVCQKCGQCHSAETRECWDCNTENCISISALVAEILRFEVFGWLP